MTHSRADDRRHQAETFCYRYIAFWLVICLVGFGFFGWPTLITGLGIIWGMWKFFNACFGERSANASERGCRH